MEHKKPYEVSLITPSGGVEGVQLWDRGNINKWPSRYPTSLLAKKKLGMVRKDRTRNLTNDDEWLVCSRREEGEGVTPFARYLRNGRKIQLPQRPVTCLRDRPLAKLKRNAPRRPSCISDVLRRTSDASSLQQLSFTRRSSSIDNTTKLTSETLHPYLRHDFTPTLIDTTAMWLRTAGVAEDSLITKEQGAQLLSCFYRHASLGAWITPETINHEAPRLQGSLEHFCRFMQTSRWREILTDRWTPALPGRCPAGHTLWAMRCGQGPGRIGKDVVRCRLCGKIGTETVTRCPPCDATYCPNCRPSPAEFEAHAVLLPFADDPSTHLPHERTIVSYTNDRLRRARLAESVHPTLLLGSTPSPSSVLAPASITSALRDAMVVLYNEKPGDILDEVLAFFSTTTPHGTTFNEFHACATMVEVWCGDQLWYTSSGTGLLYFAAMLMTQSGADLDRFLGYIAPPPLQDSECQTAETSKYEPKNPSHADNMYALARRIVSVDSVQTLDTALEALRPYIKTLVTLAVMAEPYKGVLSVPASSLDVKENLMYATLVPVLCTKGEDEPNSHTLHIDSCFDVGVVPFLNGGDCAVMAPLTCFSVNHNICLEDEGSIVKARGEQPFPFSPYFKADVEEALEGAFARLKEIPAKGSVLRYISASGQNETSSVMSYTFMTDAS